MTKYRGVGEHKKNDNGKNYDINIINKGPSKIPNILNLFTK